MRRDIKAGAEAVPQGSKSRQAKPQSAERAQVEGSQDRMLEEWRRLAAPLDVYLRNGTRIRGVLKGFDPFVIALDSEEGLRVVYKQVILTIGPAAARPSEEPGSRRPILTLKRRPAQN